MLSAADLPDYTAVTAALTALHTGVSDAEFETKLAEIPVKSSDAPFMQALRRLHEHVSSLSARRMLDGVLHEIALELARKHDRESALSAIVRKTRAILGADMSYISLNDFSSNETYIHTVDGVTSNEYRSIRMPFGTGVLGAVASADLPAQTSNYLEDESLVRIPSVDAAVDKEGVCAILGAPLRVDGRLIGALMVADRHPHPYGAAEIDTIESIAALAAVAIETTQLIDELNDSLARLHDSQEATRGYVAELEKVAQTDSVLFAALTSMKGLSRITADLRRLLGVPVVVFSAAEIHVAPGEPHAGGEASPSILELAEASAAAGEPVVGAASLSGESREVTVLSAVVNGQILGVLCAEALLDGQERLIMQRAAMMLTAQFLFDQALEEASTRELSAILEQLVTDPAPPEASVLRRLHSFGTVLAEHVTVLVVTTSDVALARSTIAQVFGRSASTLAHGSHLCALVSADDPLHLAQDVAKAMVGAGASATVGCAGALLLSGGLPAAHAKAVAISRTLAALGRQGEAATESTLGTIGLLLGNISNGFAQSVVAETLEPLLRYDAQYQTQLVETAAVFLDMNGNVARCAAELHYHQNTIRQRVDRIGELLGNDWRESARALDIHLALRLWQLLNAQVTDSAQRGEPQSPELSN